MIRWTLAALLAILVVAGVYGGYRLLLNLTRVDLSAPPAFGLTLCGDPVARGGKTVVIAAGDSLTRGNMSHSYVADARERLGRDILLLNAGKNGDTIEQLADRLDAIIACDPDMVTLLIGTNDAVRPAVAPASWDRETAAFRAILGRLKTEADASLAVFSLPLAGGHAYSGLNQRTGSLSSALVAAANGAGVPVLPLRARQELYLEEGGLSVRSGHPPCATFDDVMEALPGVRRQLARKGAETDYDAIADRRGHILVIDCIHFSGIGARPATDLLVDFVRSGGGVAIDPGP